MRTGNNGRRSSHVGKSRHEKEVYRKFLDALDNPDKTEEDPIDLNKTNESSFEEEESLVNTPIKKKSSWLKVKDFFNNNWVIAVVSGLLLLLLTGYITMNREQGIHGERLNTMEGSIEDLEDDIDIFGGEIDSVRYDLDIFQFETGKEFELLDQGK
jgi:hypothetical protein